MWSKSVLANVFSPEKSPFFFAVAMVGNSNDTGNAELETFDSQILQAKIKLATSFPGLLTVQLFDHSMYCKIWRWEGLVTRVRARKIS